MNRSTVKSQSSVLALTRFFAVNVVLLILLLMAYLPMLMRHQVAVFFSVVGLAGQAVLFIAVPACLVLFSAWVFPRLRSFYYVVSLLIMSLLVLLTVLDWVAFHLYQFHVFSLLWMMLKSGAANQVLSISAAEWIAFVAAIMVIVVCEAGLLRVCVHYSKRYPFKCSEQVGWLLLLLLPVVSYVMVADQLRMRHPHPIPTVKDIALQDQLRITPYYHVLATHLLPEHQPVSSQRVFHYPRFHLNTVAPKHYQNVVFIVIDTWRYDAFNRVDSPNIWKFAQTAWQFTQHYSGGNFTEPGIFSLFYSIPPVYWNAVLREGRTPVMLDQMQKDHYQMGIFGSASLSFPPFQKTVFRHVAHLQVDTPGDSPVQRDQTITHEFSHFILDRNVKKPFFSFLFYDEVHDWCGSSQPYAKPFQPAIQTCNRLFLSGDTNPTPYMNRYKNAVHYVDSLVGRDLRTLKQHDLLKNTVVIITADHGEEFNDEHLGLWGHGSAYDKYQLHIPFIAYFPNRKPTVMTKKTSHYDVVPTIMRQVLGNINPTADYSVGRDLFHLKPSRCFWVGGANGFALMNPHSEDIFFTSLKTHEREQYPSQQNTPMLSRSNWASCSAVLWRYDTSRSG